MSYENRPPPEGINVSDESHLLQFLLLLGAVLLIIVVAVIGLSAAAGSLVRFVPFSVEERLAALVLDESAAPAGTGAESAPADQPLTDEPPTEDNPRRDPRTEARRCYLEALAARLGSAMDLPAQMRLRVHYVDAPMVNAFATLGGHIFIYQGLIEQLESENALALVVGHEIAHVQQRHPIVAAGRGLTLSLALGSVFGVTDNWAVRQVVNLLGVTSTMSFSRAQERSADAAAAHAVGLLYGHLSGTVAVFEVLAGAAAGALAPPEFFSTHPDPGGRAEALAALAAGSSGSLTPLPAALFRDTARTE